MSENKLALSLGDIIKVIAPSNTDIHNQIFLITYLDDGKIILINSAEDAENRQVEIAIHEGKLSDETIENVVVVNKAKEKGFARQKKLLPQTWVDIYFKGEIPMIITGEISNLEEDMIEVEIYPDKKKILIDFAYRGIPPDIPIEKINIREAPISTTPSFSPEEEEIEIPSDKIDRPPDLQADIKEGDEVVFGEEEFMIQVIEVPLAERRFGIGQQSEDLLDELLAAIPSKNRTNRVLNNIHIMIERFKQLRKEYSIMDQYGNPEKPLIKGALYKPLVKSLFALAHKLSWIIPIAKNRRKLYNIEDDDAEDVISLTLAGARDAEYQLMKDYKQNTIPGDQNKYSFLMNALNDMMVPFAETLQFGNILVEKNVQTNLNVVINNIGEFYSTAFGVENIDLPIKKSRAVVHNAQYVIENYIQGLTKLESVRESITKTSIQRMPLTPNDTIDIQSFLTLPYSVMKYSTLNLPNSSILNKAQLNKIPFNYWQLLNKKTNIISQEANQHDDFFDGIKEISYEDEESYGEEKYNTFLEVFIPKTNMLFELMKQYITDVGSYIQIINQLEPLLIYPDDISFQQYSNIIHFLDEKIIQIKKTYIEHKQESERYYLRAYRIGKQHIKPPTNTFLMGEDVDYIEHFYSISQDVHEGVGDYKWISDSEVLNTMLAEDGAKVLTNLLTLKDIDLHGYFIGTIDTDTLEHVTQQLTTQQEENKCEEYILAKRYIEVDEFDEDNDKEIFFDKRYDITRYSILDELVNKRLTMGKDEFEEFLIEHLQINIGMSPTDATLEAKALLRGKRRVEEGDYAMLVVDDDVFKYYKRINNKWILDEKLEGGHWTNIFCNLQKKCLKVEGQCNDKKINDLIIQRNLLNEIVEHFDNENQLSKEELKVKLNNELVNNKARAMKLIYMRSKNAVKYDIEKIKIGLTYQQKDIIISPHARLIDLILAQGDFVKKQSDIKKFVAHFCRIGEGETESPFWYYDAALGVPLLPTFLKSLADAFEEGKYNEELQKIAAKQGKLSEGGDIIIDTHSGYEIKKIDLVTLEAYDEQGFRQISSALMEEDLGDTVPEVSEEKKFETKDAQKIYNVVMAMSRFLNISIESQIDFIIKNVLDVFHKIIPSESKYNKSIKKKKRAKPYIHIKNNALLMLTLCYMIITIQTMIPSIRTRKTFPGCKRSFKGFPFDDDGHTDFLTYIACIVYNITLEGEPWNTLKKYKKRGVSRTTFQQENIKRMVHNLKSLFQKSILKREEVDEKIKLKRDFLSTNPEDDVIPEEHSILKWYTFLPPLQLIRIPPIRNINDRFVATLHESMEKNNINQLDKLSVVEGKIILFSMAIQQSIQRVINTHPPLLTTMSDEPFLQNVCCNMGPKNTLQYFTDIETSIPKHNRNVIKLSRIIQMAAELSKAPFLYDPRDTKLIYPPVSDIFSEITIYKAFIRYCRFNSGIPLQPALQDICIDNKSTFLLTDSFEEKMNILKQEGKHYTLDHLYQLLRVVEQENIVPLDLNLQIISARTRLEALLDDFELKDIQHRLFPIFRESLDYIDIQEEDDQDVMRRMQRYLDLSITELKNTIYDFIRHHVNISSRKLKEIKEIIETLGNWNIRGENIYMTREDETNFFAADYFKNSIYNIINIFPTIILNNVDFRNAPVPKHWNISLIHSKNIQEIVLNQFGSLNAFYENPYLMGILRQVYLKTRNIMYIIDAIPFFARTKDLHILYGGDIFKSLMQFYYLTALNEYILQKDFSVMVSSQEGVEQVAATAMPAKGATLMEIDIIKGEQELIYNKLAELMIDLLYNYQGTKKILNKNNEIIHERILKEREKEKNKMTQNLKELSKYQREVEDLMKKHRLGKWNIGMTRALFEYDKEQYDKEWKEIQADANLELQAEDMGDATEMNKNLYKMDLIGEQQAEKAAWHEANDISMLPNDDDFGDRDGDEGY